MAMTDNDQAPLQFMPQGVWAPRSSDGPQSTGEVARQLWEALPAGRPFTQVELERILARELSIPTFDSASVGIAVAEVRSARLVFRDGEGLYRRAAEFPQDLMLSQSEQLVRAEQARLQDVASLQRDRERDSAEAERRAAQERDDLAYADVSRHIARYLRECGLMPDAVPVAPPSTPTIRPAWVQSVAYGPEAA